MTVEKIGYKGWPNCFRVSNGEAELILTSDIGPRIVRFGFTGGQNLFHEFEAQLGGSGEPVWMPRGGHRLWIAPEDPVRSYVPDNAAIAVRVTDGAIEATQPVEDLTGIEKKMTVKMDAAGVEVVHTLRNTGGAAVHVAPWALTMMAAGGHGIHGFPPRGEHPAALAATNPLVMWAFTDLADPRWRLSRKYLVLRQEPGNAAPQKLGAYNERTWGAYLLNGELFIKRYYPAAPSSEYPDFGCSFETFTNADFLELETLGPLQRLSPGEATSHTERWSLHRDIRVEDWSDCELDHEIGSLI